MGEQIRKVAFILFALIFVGIIAAMNSTVLSTATNGNKQLSTTLQTSDTASLEIYNDSAVGGSQVQSAAKNPSSVSTTNLIVGVITKAAPSKVYVYASSAPDASNLPFQNYENNSASYAYNPSVAESAINSGSQFHSYLISNANGVICAVMFVQEGAVTDTSTLAGFVASNYTCAALNVGTT